MSARPQMQRGEGEQAGAGADVGDVARAHAHAPHAVEHGEAAGGGFMLAGAKGAARLDQQIDMAGRLRIARQIADMKAAGGDGL